MKKLPLVEVMERLSASYPDEGWAERMVRALPHVVGFYLPGEAVSLRFQDSLETVNGTCWWDPRRGRYVIVLRPCGPNRQPADVVRTALHEIAHLRLGHVPKEGPLVTWVMADGTVSEAQQNRLVAARAGRPEINAIAMERERAAMEWADKQLAVLGLA